MRRTRCCSSRLILARRWKQRVMAGQVIWHIRRNKTGILIITSMIWKEVKMKYHTTIAAIIATISHCHPLSSRVNEVKEWPIWNSNRISISITILWVVITQKSHCFRKWKRGSSKPKAKSTGKSSDLSSFEYSIGWAWSFCSYRRLSTPAPPSESTP